MNKHYCNKLILLILITNAPCFPSEDTTSKANPYGLCFIAQTEHDSLQHITQLLTQVIAGQDIKAYCKEMEIKPLHMAIQKNISELIEPLVRLGFDPNELDDYRCEPLWYTIQQEPPQLDIIKELIRCGGSYREIKFIDTISKTALSAYCFYENISEQNIMHLLNPKAQPEWFNNTIFKLSFYNPIITLFRKACEAGWKTKTWRRMIVAFLMASHTRTGLKSPVQLLCQNPRLFQYIADKVPTHMDMNDRLARRARKKSH